MGQIIDVSEALAMLGLSSGATEEERMITNMCINASEAAITRHLQYNPTYTTHTEYYPQAASLGTREYVWEVSDTTAYQRSVSSNAEILQLKQLPIRSITSLYIDYDARSGTKSGAFPSTTLQSEGVDFWANYNVVDSDGNKVCMDGILYSYGSWPIDPGAIKITYTAGYTQKELHGQDSVINAYSIVEVALDETVRRVQAVFNRGKKAKLGYIGPVVMERLGDYSYRTDQNLLRQIVGGMDLMDSSVDRLQSFVNYGYNMWS